MKTGFGMLLCIAALVSLYGTPHWLHETTCQSYDRHSCAYIVSCTYIGVQGWRVIYPDWQPDAHPCRGVAFFALDWPPFRWRNG